MTTQLVIREKHRYTNLINTLDKIDKLWYACIIELCFHIFSTNFRLEETMEQLEELKEEIQIEVEVESFPKSTNAERLLQVIRNSIYSNHYTQKKIAELIKISEIYLTLVFTGRRNLNEKVLDFFGYEKVITYRKKEGLSAWETTLMDSKK